MKHKDIEQSIRLLTNSLADLHSGNCADVPHNIAALREIVPAEDEAADEQADGSADE